MECLGINSKQGVDWDRVKRCVVQVSNFMAKGQGIAISPHFVLTALHGSFVEGNEFDIALIDGKLRKGRLHRQWFEV